MANRTGPKAAYAQRRGRPSASQQHRLDRSDLLQDRAQAIKDKAGKRKMNAKKRRRRQEWDRESRRRMGILSHQPYISPRQSRMTGFWQPLQQAARDSGAR